MRILHILDHSLPLQSGYVYRTLGIVDQQRALGWDPMLLTSGKHYAPGPARERDRRMEVPAHTAADRVRRQTARSRRADDHQGPRRFDEVVGEVKPDIFH